MENRLDTAAGDDGRIYPGLVPFRDNHDDIAIFFGRDHARRALTQMIAAESLVLVYGRSGVGKTSLLQAGVFDTLRNRAHLPVVVRAGAASGGIGQHVIEAIRAEAHRQQISIENAEGRSTLWEFLAFASLRSANDETWRPVIVLDQFEELFVKVDEQRRSRFIDEFADIVRHRVPIQLETQYRKTLATLPKADSERVRLTHLLYGRTPLDATLVVVIREDRLAELQRLQFAIPTIFNSMYRVLPLDVDAAKDAIERPAKVRGERGFVYAPEAVDQMLSFLADRSAQDSSMEGVSPALLQILCSHVDERRRHKADPTRVDVADLGGTRGMQRAVQTYYRDALDALPRFRLGWNARRWRPSAENLLIFSRPRAAAARLIEIGMTTRAGWRTAVVEDVIREDFGVPDRAMETLVNRRLCVGDRRLGRSWYELAHDRLVEPALRERARRRLTQKIAAVALLAVALFIIVLLDSMTVTQWRGLMTELHMERDPVLRAKLIDEARRGDRSIDLAGAKLPGIDLRSLGKTNELTEIDFRGGDLSRSHFDHVGVRRAWFDGANLRHAWLQQSSFTEVSLIAADLSAADLRLATFTDSDFSRAKLNGAQLARTKFIGCSILGADFSGVTGIESASFDGTAWWEATGWSGAARRTLFRRWPPEKLARSDSYRKSIAELESSRRWNLSQYNYALASNDLAIRRGIHGRDFAAALVAADDAVRSISHRKLEAFFDRWFRPPAAVRHVRAEIFDTRGYLRLVCGDVRGASDDFKACLREWPRSPVCTYHSALAAAAGGDLLAARALLARSRILGYQPSYELLDLAAAGSIREIQP